MSEPKPVWKYTLQDRDGNPIGDLDIPEVKIEYDWNLPPSSDSIFNGWKTMQMDRIALAFSVPPDLLRSHVGAIEAAQEAERQMVMTKVRETQELIADAFLPFIRAAGEYTDTMARLNLELEALRMKMIGRRYQAILAVLVVVVYLIVWMVTNG